MARGVTIESGVRFGHGVRCNVQGTGTIRVGAGTEIGARTSLSAGDGAEVEIGPAVFIAGDCIVAASRRVSVGAGSMIAELVSVRDHDHDPAYPPREGRMLVGEVSIGERTWIAAKSTVVRSAGCIGNDATVAAHALVNRPVEPGWLVAGVPARPVRKVR
jgi:acetyltransferase-like isoleucine patch superfamily enzyme